MDAYWAKDILELFRPERRTSFQRLLELGDQPLEAGSPGGSSSITITWL